MYAALTTHGTGANCRSRRIGGRERLEPCRQRPRRPCAVPDASICSCSRSRPPSRPRSWAGCSLGNHGSAKPASVAVGPAARLRRAARERGEVARPPDLLGRPAEQLVVRADGDGQRARLRALPAARRRCRRPALELPHRRHLPGRRCVSEPEEGLDRPWPCTRTCCPTTGCWSRRSRYRRASTSRTRRPTTRSRCTTQSTGAARRMALNGLIEQIR